MKLNTRTSLQIRPSVNRPKVTFNVEEDMASVNDSDSNAQLPIVELKPFIQKVWRREKSLPSFYNKNENGYTSRNSNKTTENGISTTRTSSRSHEVEEEDDGEDEQDEFPSPPPRTSHSLPASLPTQRLVNYQINNVIGTNRIQRETSSLCGSPEPLMRSKSRIHPPVDSKTSRHPEHAISLIPGFITREDREKTTFIDISEGEFDNRAYSCSPKLPRTDERKRYQAMKVKGENMSRVLHPKSFSCPTSWRANGSFQGVRHGSPASILYHNRSGREKHIKHIGNTVYDQLDRKGVLPSLMVQPKRLKHRVPQQSDENVSEDYMDIREAYETQSGHNVGGIENSLKVLSEQGEPTKIERMLTFQLEFNLNRFRALKDYSPLETSPSELAKYYSTPNFNLTQGEVNIRKGLISNTARRSKNFYRSGSTLTKEKLMAFQASTEYHNFKNQRSKVFDRLRSLETNMPDYGVFERNDSRGMTNLDKGTVTDDDLTVPNDTPRTHVESRVSFKPTDSAIDVIPKEAASTQRENVNNNSQSLTANEKCEENTSTKTENDTHKLKTVKRQSSIRKKKDNIDDSRSKKDDANRNMDDFIVSNGLGENNISGNKIKDNLTVKNGVDAKSKERSGISERNGIPERNGIRKGIPERKGMVNNGSYSGVNEPLHIDGDGKTFLTSDRHAQISVTG